MPETLQNVKNLLKKYLSFNWNIIFHFSLISHNIIDFFIVDSVKETFQNLVNSEN